MKTNYIVVILHYKTIDKTISCVESIIKNDDCSEMLIVDNHSNNGSIEKIIEMYKDNKRIHFLLLDKNIGFARANNVAMRKLLHLGYEYAILSNNDIEFTQNSIRILISSFDKHNNTLIVAPKVKKSDGEIQDSVQIKRDRRFMYLFHQFFPTKPSLLSQKAINDTKIEVFSGCCFACDLKKMEKCGYMDEHTFLYYEEAIISAKASEKKYSMFFIPKAIVVHHHASSTKLINELVMGYMLDSEIHYMKEYLKIPKIVIKCYCFLKILKHKKKYNSHKLLKMEKSTLKRI